MNWHGAEEAIDRVRTAGNLRPSARRQQAKAQLAQERQAPLVVGEASAWLRGRQLLRGGAKLRPVFAQAVPGLGDDLVQSLALRKAVILRPRTIELFSRIEHAA